MASSPVQSDWTPDRGAAPSSLPESSLTWCVTHLEKPRSGDAALGHGGDASAGLGDMDHRMCQWRALVAVRTQHIKGDKAGITRFRTQGGLRPLLDLLRHPECSRKTLDLALSILANCCTELETCVEVRRLDGIHVVVDILKKNVALETVQNRAARALGNLAMDPENSALIHSAGGVPLLLLCMSSSSFSSSPAGPLTTDSCPKLECAQSAARALFYLSDTPSNRLSLLTQGTLSTLTPLIAPDYPLRLRRAALKTIHELTRGCGVECAREVSRSGVLTQLGVMASGEAGNQFEELALKSLANLCSQGCLRPLVGSLGVIPKFTEEVKKDPLKSGVFLKALCLCCKEAVNRSKVKESGALEVIIGFLSAHQNHPLSRLVILACVDFVFDESAMEHLQELGLVALLVARLINLTKGEELSAEKMDMSLISSMSPTEFLPSSSFDSFDFPPPEGYKKEEASKEQGLCSPSFLSLRSWLLSEGLISSEGDLLDSSGMVEGEWGSLQIPQSSPQVHSPNHNCHSSLKSSSPSSPIACSTSKKAAQPSHVTSPVQLQLPCSSKTTDTTTSSLPRCGVLTPQTQADSSSGSAPVKTTQMPISPTKFTTPHRRRQRTHSAVCLTKLSPDTPRSVPRPLTYHHPYHPEPWTPESPVLLLLSRFSHNTDPSAALVNAGVMSGLMYYLTQHQDPSNRCFRLLCRLSCNPNCLQALVRTGSVALIHHHLCQRERSFEGEERQTNRVRAKVQQLGLALLSNLRVQCESGFGSGVLAHVMLSGSESDKMYCALSLPLISSNKTLLKKLLVDSGGLLTALQHLGCDDEGVDEDNVVDSRRLASDRIHSPHLGLTSQMYFSLLIGCLSALMGVRTEHNVKHLSPAKMQSISRTGKLFPPPSKKPRLADACPYSTSEFDLLLLLDDGTKIPANREAVAGSGGADEVFSEYFRALLKGGFGEARGSVEEAVCIKEVSVGMVLPVLHYLHGCSLSKYTETREGGEGQCQILELLVLEGLGFCQKEADEHSEQSFQKTPLVEMMVGACRFMVTELQRELEELCVSLLLSCSTKTTCRATSVLTEDCTMVAGSKKDRECLESAEENLANRTSELELSAFEVHVEYLPEEMKKPNGSSRQTDGKQSDIQNVRGGVSTALDQKTIANITLGSKFSSAPVVKDKPANTGEFIPRPKTSTKASAQIQRSVAALLPQIYWFSQQYSYPALGRACLSVLLGGQDAPQAFMSSSAAGHCLHRLAREAGCTDALKQDLLHLATVALS
ncbi:armadillo repeat-containing protein 5 [Thalassophryne amazonica]|uniref:armadillo repeat-containing protein 5 n=1 Tax=Thalassophryne amazonica TaxID=390379 RepID=UPI0014713E53|nr:armadillo repeat-containing protein 5 [Thalassophryne amazonica]